MITTTNFHCALCLVYGAHGREEKRGVWEELSYVAGLCQVPFCFLGDFNEIMYAEDRKGATSLPTTGEEFKRWVHDIQLMDLALTDRKYIWFRGRSCSRIDRVLVNVEWTEKFSDIRLKGGPRGLSDHCPLIVEGTKLQGGPRPFRSLDSWFTHEGFLRMVKTEWRSLEDAQFTCKLKALIVPLRQWHKNTFGDMDKRLMRFEEEITRLGNLARIKGAIRGFYKDLYRQEYVPRIGVRDGLVKQISRDEAAALEVLPSEKEIKEAVWDCGSSKTPRSDGYNMNFIKKFWEDIGLEFIAAVLGFFQSAKLPMDLNVTWVTLAPKVEGAKEVKDFRPISMVGCVYKVISKKMGFGLRWRNWVRECVTTATMAILDAGGSSQKRAHCPVVGGRRSY
ncbi:uncharacterized protein LOC107632665 [Arachis ipaensis]|uniref:uncharacterized protein LOC107632665 n=1 Tax=Arachis ipaensis TaxID=130454 RepID=UPI0007AFA931|nr:uncharacterized protein LOC107632665 [Arachis ipaensis]